MASHQGTVTDTEERNLLTGRINSARVYRISRISENKMAIILPRVGKNWYAWLHDILLWNVYYTNFNKTLKIIICSQ